METKGKKIVRVVSPLPENVPAMLAEEFGCSLRSAWYALKGERNSELAQRIRRRALHYGYLPVLTGEDEGDVLVGFRRVARRYVKRRMDNRKTQNA